MPGADDNNNPNPGDKDKNKEKPNPNPGDKGNGGSGDDLDGMSPEDMKKVIKDLRKENAASRTKSKSQEDSFKTLSEQLSGIKKHLGIKDDVDPAEQIKGLTAKTEDLELELSLQQLARAHNIPVEHDEYFRFMIGKKTSALKDDEELGEDAIKEVVEEVQKYSGFKSAKPNKNGTGVDENGGGKKDPASGGGGGMTPEQFAKLNINEKSKLYVDNKPEYDLSLIHI